jgi:ABC-type multidrug transport system fused ATPase/permease subunit
MTFINNLQISYVFISPFKHIFFIGLFFGTACSYLDAKLHKEVSLLITSDKSDNVIIYNYMLNILYITFFTGLFGAIRGGIFTYINTRIYDNVVKKIFFNITKSSMDEWDIILKQDELSKCVLGDISHVIDTLCFLFNVTARTSTSIIYVSYILYNLSFNILCLCIGLSTLHVYLFHNIYPWHGKYVEISNKNKLDLEKHMNEYIQKYNGIILYSWQDFYYNIFEVKLKVFKDSVPIQSVVYSILTLLTHIICKWGEIILIFFLIREKKDVPVIIEVISYYNILTNTINTLKDVSLNTIKSKEQVKRVWDIYCIYNDKKDNVNLLELNNLLENKYSISFNNIDFAYPSDINTKIFDNFSLNISEGEHITLVAKSGSGKTTLLKLLLNQYKLNSGEILINNCNICNIPKNILNKLINIVPQEPVFFTNLSIFENIVMGNNNKSKEDVIEILEKVQLSSFISKMDEPLIELSGGQKQRLAIARILVNSCPIIILDEPTSALDKETTHLIMDNLKVYMENKIVIVITHNHDIISSSMKKIYLGKDEKDKII